jgi:hypothetical protein
MTKFGLAILAICCFGVFTIFSSMDFAEQQKAAEPSKAKPIETFAHYQARIEKLQEVLLRERMDELLSAEYKPEKNK